MLVDRLASCHHRSLDVLDELAEDILLVDHQGARLICHDLRDPSLHGWVVSQTMGAIVGRMLGVSVSGVLISCSRGHAIGDAASKKFLPIVG